MIKRTLYFGNPAYLSLQDQQLLVHVPPEKNNETSTGHSAKVAASIPIEDVGVVVLDHPRITITQALMRELQEHTVAIICCDNRHHPSALMLPLCGNTLQNERYRTQIQASEPLKKQLWAQTISQKIKNQQAHLQLRNIPHTYLHALHKNVKSGDSQNNEATAAAYYWKALSPVLYDPPGNFTRLRAGVPPNNLLNYAYALLRATMARSIVAAGMLPTLGIHHHNRYNAYCLADDLMEPYRPFADHVVCNLLQQYPDTEELSKNTKQKLLELLACDVLINQERSPLMVATQRTATSLLKCFEGSQKKLLYPDFVG